MFFQKTQKIMVAMLVAMVIIIMPISAQAATISDKFEDVESDKWYSGAVNYVVSNDLFYGTSEKTFSPNGSMTRGMFVTVLGRKSQIDITEYTDFSFSDVPVNEWFAPYVQWAEKYGIVSGTGNGKFNPFGKITREEMATILFRYVKATGNNGFFDDEIYFTFPDRLKISTYAGEGFKWATFNRVVQGKDGKLKAYDSATRAEVAQILHNADAILKDTQEVQNVRDEDDDANGTIYPTDSEEMKQIKRAVASRLKYIYGLSWDGVPYQAKWNEKLSDLNKSAWVGPMNLNYVGLNGIIESSLYALTDYGDKNTVYDIYYISELSDGFYIHYG